MLWGTQMNSTIEGKGGRYGKKKKGRGTFRALVKKMFKGTVT